MERRLLTLDDGGGAHEALFAAGLTDGLPVVAPTPPLVDAMLAAGPWAADDVLLHEPSRGLDVVAHQVATCSVLAGATPESFPVVGAAVEALGDPAFQLYGPLTSTGGAATMVVVSGPAAERLGVNGREGLLGPGSRANATIGRAVRLVQLHALLAVPGVLDRSTQGWPGRFTLCFSENVEASPWPPIHVAVGHPADTSTVTVFACESGHAVVNHGAAEPTPLLATFADTMAALGSFSPGRSVVVVAPEHAATLAGLTRADVQHRLYDQATRDLATLKRCGKIEHAPGVETDWEGEWLPVGDTAVGPADGSIRVHRGWSPADILVLVGGGTAGGHSTFFPSWSRTRGVPAITRAVPT